MPRIAWNVCTTCGSRFAGSHCPICERRSQGKRRWKFALLCLCSWFCLTEVSFHFLGFYIDSKLTSIEIETPGNTFGGFVAWQDPRSGPTWPWPEIASRKKNVIVLVFIMVSAPWTLAKYYWRFPRIKLTIVHFVSCTAIIAVVISQVFPYEDSDIIPVSWTGKTLHLVSVLFNWIDTVVLAPTAWLLMFMSVLAFFDGLEWLYNRITEKR